MVRDPASLSSFNILYKSSGSLICWSRFLILCTFERESKSRKLERYVLCRVLESRRYTGFSGSIWRVDDVITSESNNNIAGVVWGV